jgi:hypothetical protein
MFFILKYTSSLLKLLWVGVREAFFRKLAWQYDLKFLLLQITMHTAFCYVKSLPFLSSQTEYCGEILGQQIFSLIPYVPLYRSSKKDKK